MIMIETNSHVRIDMIRFEDLTFSEKLRLLTGQDCWRTDELDGKLPALFMSDGPGGLRRQTDVGRCGGCEVTMRATAYPCPVAVADSWSEEIAFEVGHSIAQDCAELGVDLLLAPGCNIKRTPVCGRNFEYFSEDPLLAGRMAKAYVEGVRAGGVGVSVKHFCANNREFARLVQSSEVDARALHEIYLEPFRIAVGGDPDTVMCSYNRVNGVYASENGKLLTDILRGELGFKGAVISDWGAVHERARSLKAGLDIEMPFRKESYGELLAAYERGEISEEEIDACARRVYDLICSLTEKRAARKKHADGGEAHKIALKAAQEGIVLLKNDGILPLKKESVAVIGDFAATPAHCGGGSAHVLTTYQMRPLHEELRERTHAKTEYAPGVSPHFVQELSEPDALMLAYRSDVAVIAVGNEPAEESEGMDRNDIRLRAPLEKLILDVAAVNPNTVVILETGSAVDVTPWEHAVKGILFAGYAGEAVNEALADILTGAVCPSGKLAETFPLSLEESACGSERGNGFVERYREGIFVGYRYYDAYDRAVRYPFGFGLSYAKFEYSSLTLERKGDKWAVGYTVKNISDAAGAEVSQVYVRDPFSYVSRPVRELKGFCKSFLKAGEEKRVEVLLDRSAFSYWSETYDGWYLEGGDFEIEVGASDRDIRLKGKITIDG